MNRVEVPTRHPEVARFEDLARRVANGEKDPSSIILTSFRTQPEELRDRVEKLIRSGEAVYLADLDGLGNRIAKDLLKEIRKRGYMTIEFFARMWPDDPGDRGYFRVSTIKPVFAQNRAPQETSSEVL